MHNLKDLLQKYANFGLKEKLLKEKVIKILNEQYKIFIERKDFEIKNKKIIFKISGSKKTEIVLNKNKIITELGGEIIDVV